MKRELKFRVWDKEPKKMIYLNNAHHSFNFYKGHASFYHLENGSGGDEYEIMQFTGLNDKNGKEIYEFDLVMCIANERFMNTEDDNVVGKIVSGESGTWQVVYKDCSSGLPLAWGGYDSLEIIGNIYQDKELLK